MTSTHIRNDGTPLDLAWVKATKINKSAVTRHIKTLAGRRTAKKNAQIAWQLKAISLIDLTTLDGHDTDDRVRRLCAKAKQPLRKDILAGLGMDDLELTVGAVCVYHNRVKAAVAALAGTDIPVAVVSTGFPTGQVPVAPQLKAINQVVEHGAREIDIVISREYVHTGNWQAIYDQIKAYRDACGPAHLKTILETGELGSLANVYKASIVAMMAGSDFIKTSTGKTKVNATLPVGYVMCRAIRDYERRTDFQVGFKPAGGIRTSKDALSWMSLLKQELGDEWLEPELFRFGASSLLGDLEKQLSHHATGRYASGRYMPSS